MLKIGAGWMLLALFAGEMGALHLLPPAGPPMVLGTLTLGLLAASALVSPFRAWVESLDLRAIVAFHLVRFVGLYFLVLESRGQMPASVAIPAGLGDIAVAVGAAFIVVLRPLYTSRGVVALWNVFGLADILFVVSSAARMAASHPMAMDHFRELPLSFLPTMIVPIIIASHVVLFVRLSRGALGSSQDLPAAATPRTSEL